jgi:hypothetical protein
MMIGTTRKPVSYLSKNSQSLFSIHLIEGPDGRVSALAEWVGRGPNVFDIGFEIMQKLELASLDHPDRLAVQPLTYCKNYQ